MEAVPMPVSSILKKMIGFSQGNLHDINHFLKVYAYAKTIGELEGVDPETRLILEVAAITHDIACPLCRERYGNTNGKYQEREGGPMVLDFLKDTGLKEAQIQRVAWLVGHHHTPEPVEGIDHRILLEADYLVNADESSYPIENLVHTKETVFRTKAGISLLESIYHI
jgi:hypothetical protein